ncbi:MAG TPA: ATP-binding protein [Polyangiaceae bacterium]|jgi:signal transduction histidine kinase|nr:ATP-binding protein [Polyangiaceae bacterium]
MMPTYLEVAGLAVALAACVIVFRRRYAIPTASRVVLFGLLSMLVTGHVANVLEWSGHTWADTLADEVSVIVPLLWGLFLLEIGRSYLSAQVDAGTAQLRFFLEKVPVAVAFLDPDSRLTAYSLAWSRSFSASDVGAPLARVLPAPLPALERALASLASSDTDPVTAEEESCDEHGRARYFRWVVRSLSHPDHERPVVLLILDEITTAVEAQRHRTRAAVELARAQRLAHVGQLAAGAAHDFNNLLHVIQAAASELEEGGDRGHAMEEMQAALRTAAALTKSMLQFGKAGTQKRAALDFRALVVDLQKLLNHVLGRRHRVVMTVDPNRAVNVYGNEARLQQAVLNLVTNARDAMPDGGDIQLSLEVVGQEVRLCVRDSGVGMSEEVRKQLFAPFFTTKDASGTGLGLNVVRSVVEEHQGSITLDSQLGLGTTFRISLPLHEAPAATA